MKAAKFVQRDGLWCACIAITETYTSDRAPTAARRNARGAVRSRAQVRTTSHYEVPLGTSDRTTAEERLCIVLGQKEGPLPDLYSQAMRSFYLERKR